MNYSVKDNKVFFTFCGKPYCLTCTDEGVFRFQTANGNNPDDMGASQQLSADIGEERNDTVRAVTVEEKCGEIKVTDPAGNYAVISVDSISFFTSDGVMKECITGVTFSGDKTAVALKLPDGRKVYGAGEHFDNVNHRGKRLTLYAIDRWCRTRGNSYCPVPFVITSDCTGIFMNRYEYQIFDIGKADSSVFSIILKNAPVDLYVMLADKPEKLLYRYSKLTGFAPVPADWMFGTQVCRYHPDFGTPEGVLEMTRKMKSYDLPWEAVIIEGWAAFDKSRFGELRQLCSDIHGMGKKLMVYEGCGRILPNFDADFGFSDDDSVHCGNSAHIPETRSLNLVDHSNVKTMRCTDLTNPEALKKWNDLWDTLVFDIGIDGAKIDFCEQFPDSADIKFADGRRPDGAHHAYPTVYNILQYRRFNSKEYGGMNFSRGGGIGAQRYPFIWAGDQLREFRFLKAVLKAVLSCGFSGIPFLSWDAAGYRNAMNPYDRVNEDRVFLRGIQLAAFSANIQTHGRVKRPYDFDSHTIDVYRAYAKLHDAMRPYLKKMAEKSANTGIPLMRHLFLYDFTDETCGEIDDEYMLGDSLLVAPVLSRAVQRDIYLPKGKWQDVFTGTEHIGPKWINKYHAPLETAPVFRLIDSEEECFNEDAMKYIEDIKALSK